MSKKISKRIDWIDALKGLGMFFVIWGHCMSNNNYLIRKYIYSFHMPLFFFVSGLTSKKDLNLDFKSFLIKKIKTLLVPYFVLSFFATILSFILFKVGVINSFNLFELIIGTLYSHNKVFSMPLGHLWFIVTLFLVQILFYAINKIAKNDFNKFVICLICGILGYLNSISPYELNGPWHFESAFTAVVFYFLGYIFIEKYNLFKKIVDFKFKNFCLGLMLFIIALCFALHNQGVSMHVNRYGAILSFYISSLSSILGLIIFVHLFLKNSFIFKKIGEDSIYFLCYHNFIIVVFKYIFISVKRSSLNLMLLAIITTSILFLLSFFIKKYLPILYGKSKFLNNCIDKLFVYIKI